MLPWAKCPRHPRPIHHHETQDIVRRAILTIETEGSEPTFSFTLVPDDVRSTSYVGAQSISHNPSK
jgi:hypothetical protein